MKVKATAKGFYGKFRHVGDEFEIKDKKELGSWMLDLAAEAKAKAEAEKTEKAKAKAEAK